MTRIPYGAEIDGWGADRGPCHDCAVRKGEMHVVGCDVERYPVCGGELLSCEHREMVLAAADGAAR